MHSILFISAGIVTALAVILIVALNWRDKPKKISKWEKAEIMKRLLVRADQESAASTIGSIPTGSHRLVPASSPPGGASKRRDGRVQSSEPAISAPEKNTPASLKSNPSDAEIEEQIRQRAYELYQRHGGVGRNAADDWAQARKEVLRHKARAGASS
ncbi:MAG TPA: DUF2934 domain-containing protein [Terriglobales bacterium]|nr:DUF2934 domain-containing protein [Terriglobales bacterium]